MPLNLPTTPSKPSSRAALAQYALRQLGAPVLDIVIDNDQISDRIEDAIQFFHEFHTDGTQRTYVIHQVTGNSLELVNAEPFTMSEIVVGGTSGTKATALNIFSNTVLYVDEPIGSGFIVGETVTGAVSGVTGIVTGFAYGDLHNNSIPVDDSILSVINVFPHSAATSTNSVFDIRFQLRLSDLYSLQSAELAQYEEIMYSISNIDFIFSGITSYRYNRRMNTVYIDEHMYDNISPGQYMVLEVYQALDPETYTQIYNDRALKKLCTAYLKKQWGQNMRLYGGVQLPGGITVNAEMIYQDGIKDVDDAEEHIMSTYSSPPTFMVG